MSILQEPPASPLPVSCDFFFEQTGPAGTATYDGDTYPYPPLPSDKGSDARYAWGTTPVFLPVEFFGVPHVVESKVQPHVIAPPGISILEYLWNFGDGHTGHGPIVTHTYEVPDPTTAISLTVIDSLGREFSTSKALGLLIVDFGYIYTRIRGRNTETPPKHQEAEAFGDFALTVEGTPTPILIARGGKNVREGMEKSVSSDRASVLTHFYRSTSEMSLTGDKVIRTRLLSRRTEDIAIASDVTKSNTRRFANAFDKALTNQGGGKISQRLEALLTPSGHISLKVQHRLSAQSSFTGNAKRNVAHSITASINSTGGLKRSVIHALKASLTPTGSSFAKSTVQILKSSMAFAGVTGRRVNHRLTAALSSAGSLKRSIIRQQASKVSFAGSGIPPISLLSTGINGGYEFEEGVEGTKNVEAQFTILKSKILRLALGVEQWSKGAVEFIAKEEAQRHGAGLTLIVSFDGEFGTTGIKGEKISKRVNIATLTGIIKELAGAEGWGLKFIEFGNETSYSYQYGDGFTETSYKERAREYAKMFKEVSEAAQSVGLAKPLCQADDGNSGSNVWVKEMYAQVPNLHEYVGAWVIHPYASELGGKSGPRVERLIKQVKEFGGEAAANVPIDVTEWGITSDNGNTLSDGTKLTYKQARELGETQTNEIKSVAGLHLRQFLLFQHRDQRKHSETGENREWYFGALTHENAEKGEWSTFAKSILAK